MRLAADPQNQRAVELAKRLRPLLSAAEPMPELVIVLGGDGYMLEAVRRYGHGSETFLGLNCGSLGFLLNRIPSDLEHFVADVSGRAFSRIPLPRLRMRGMDTAGNELKGWAINDIYLERMTGQTARLNLRIDGTPVVEPLVADGLVISTPIGSTGYAYSAGGVPCHPELSLMQVTPISPHHPRLPALVVPPGSHISVETVDPERRPVRAVADGVDTCRIAQLHVTLETSSLSLGFLNGADFTQRLVEKLLRH